MRTALAPSQGMVRLEMLLTDPTTSKMLTSTWEDGSVSVLRQWLYLDSADDEQGDVQGGDSQAFTQTTRVNSGGGQVPGDRVWDYSLGQELTLSTMPGREDSLLWQSLLFLIWGRGRSNSCQEGQACSGRGWQIKIRIHNIISKNISNI